MLYAPCLRTLYKHSLKCDGLSKEIREARANLLFEDIPLKDLRRDAQRSNSKRDKLVIHEEFKKLMMAAKRPRIKALLAVLYESGCRKGEIITLKIRDISFGSKYTTIRVSGKTGERAVPLIKSVPYLRQWLQVHPDRNPDSPLFATVVEGEVREAGIRNINLCLKRLCERAGVRHIHPHMFRHTRLTELARQGLGEYQLKNFGGWTPDSRMAARYLHLTGRAHVNAVLEAGGVEVKKEEREEAPYFEMEFCPNCGGSIGKDMMFCPSCGTLLEAKLRVEREDEMAALRREVQQLKETLDKSRELSFNLARGYTKSKDS